MEQVHRIDHPLITHKMTHIRDKNTGPKEFKELVEEVSLLLAYEVTRDLALEEVTIETPCASTKGRVLAGCKIGIVPILRAGLGMVDSMLTLIPHAKVGHLGIYRNENSLEPVEYYWKLPQDISKREVMVVDPMLATGGTAVAALRFLRSKGVRKMKFVCLISVPEGIRAVREKFPEVPIYTAAIDSHLDERGYIIPGLGDAGDRLYGTE